MLFNSALISSFVFASTVLADRDHERRGSQFLNRAEQSTAASDVVFNNYWAGAVWEKDNGTFTFVTGSFTVPEVSGPSGSAAIAWVGINGLCTGGPFMIAVQFDLYPEYDTFDLSISAGDVIKLNVTAPSATSGIVKVENLTNGRSAHKHLNSTLPFCGQTAEWIVGDFDLNNKRVPLANFGNVTFKDAVATGPTNKTYTPQGAIIFEILDGNKTLTSVTTNRSSVTIKHM
ncbi:concanavalin A-like lectin/glucanase [Imleria badia]|nr:concanavalin A-like lectin/glucanase [Imleria badia]